MEKTSKRAWEVLFVILVEYSVVYFFFFFLYLLFVYLIT